MGTTADIGRMNADGTIRVVHVSGDGYLAGAGAILLAGYTSPEKLDELFQHKAGACIEEWTEKEVFFLDEEEYGGEWKVEESALSYLYRDGQWFARDYDTPGHPWMVLTREAVTKHAARMFGTTQWVDQMFEDADADTSP